MLKKIVISQKNIDLSTVSLPLALIAILVCISCIIPMVIVHIWIWMYQHVFFTVFTIPKSSFWDFFIADRRYLKRLNMIQKVGCVYCSYGNALGAWVTDVANRTEVYSCAVKHAFQKKGQEHQKDFYEYEDYA